MTQKDKTREEFIEEIDLLNKRIAELERLNRECMQTEAEKARLLAIIEESPDFIGIADMQGNLQYHNKAAKKMVGLPRDIDLSGMKINDMHPSAAGKLVLEEGIPTVLSQGSWRSENVLLHRNGSEIPVSQVLVLHRDASGKPEFVSTIMRDITEERDLRERLRQSGVWYRTLFEGASEGILVVYAETKKFSFANPAICRMFGYTKEEFLQLGVADIHPKESLAHVMAEFEAQARGEKVAATDLPCLSKDGKIFYADVSTTLMTLGGKACMVGFFSDITERKKVAEALRNSEKLYRSLFENMLNGFAYCQMHFDDNNMPSDFTYLSVNSAFGALTGLKNVVGRKVSEVIPGIIKSDPELFEIYGRVSSTGKPECHEIFIRSLQMWFWISVYSLERGYFVVTFDVITERKRIEKEMRKHLHEMEVFYKAAMGREARIIELKKEVEKLNKRAGK